MSAISKILRRTQRLSVGAIHAAPVRLETQACCNGASSGNFECPVRYFSELYHTKQLSSVFFHERRLYSSSADPKKAGEGDELEDGFSELETKATAAQDHNSRSENEDELISEPDLSDDEDGAEETPENGMDQLDSESGPSEEKSSSTNTSAVLFKAIMASPGLSVSSALDKWVEEGKDLSRWEISVAMLNLRRRRMYGRALQLLEWLEANKRLDFVEKDYASRLDLIAKVRGLQKAESYIGKVPKSFRGELLYRTLLANYVSSTNVKKAEEVFNKMKDLELRITSFTCNQLLLLYKKVDKKKIADILLLMERENVKPNHFTFKTLIDAKGASKDITGMDQIVEAMKAEGFEPDVRTLAIIAKHYASAGLKEKAEAVLKEIEGDGLKVSRDAVASLLMIYGEMGKADQVERIWKVCEANPRKEECEAAIKAFGLLKKIEEAEKVFDILSGKSKKLSSTQYSCLLKVYSDNKMLTKGKELVKRMADTGCNIGPLTWDALVKLYVEAGNVGKAASILNKVNNNKQGKLMFRSYMVVLGAYAKMGDVHNAEQMFYRMRQAGYVSRLGQFEALIQAYVNAKTPAYGMKERMKADNIFPNKALAAQLSKVDVFRKSALSDLLD